MVSQLQEARELKKSIDRRGRGLEGVVTRLAGEAGLASYRAALAAQLHLAIATRVNTERRTIASQQLAALPSVS